MSFPRYSKYKDSGVKWLAGFSAIHSLLTEVCVLRRIASCVLRPSLFFNPDSSARKWGGIPGNQPRKEPIVKGSEISMDARRPLLYRQPRRL